VFLESVTLSNFQCFGPEPTSIRFDDQLTVLIGPNASGKTAACQALLRLFSVVRDQRQIRLDDFHVPHDEQESPASRSLSIEAVFAYPELNSDDGADNQTVPEFFAQMSADDDGQLKLRVVLQATWSSEGSVNGTIEESRRVVHTFQAEYGDQWVPLQPSDRNRIQMVYVPATRDGARTVNEFLRGRIWRASQWSESFREHVGLAADELATKFKAEAVVKSVTEAIAARWSNLHHLGTERNPYFEPINREVSVLVTNAEMLFEPSPTGRSRPARELSDGQQSLLHIAMTAASLDLERTIAAGDHGEQFDLTASSLPSLTVLAIEEPENNLSPYFLSRVIQQLIDVTSSGRAQALLSSHSASVLGRITPERVRHLRMDEMSKSTRVREISLPDSTTDAGKYVREAVRAHPEMYFAQFVVLGEGDSEELVLPMLAEARGLHIDRSFVAVVPLGGRHTNHFWRLLNQLNIPHATLLDLDWGRAGGGEGRIRDACTRLTELGVDPFHDLDGFSSIDEIEDLSIEQFKLWLDHLEKWDVYFATPLDLDMLLLHTFKSAYTEHLEPGATGPSAIGDPRDAVLGSVGVRPDNEIWQGDGATDNLRWYRYLFLTHSKPSTHLAALSRLSPEKLTEVPERLGRLLSRISRAVSAT
jgi:putative ATP-dependent endonuclease of the OLD family